MKERGVVYIVSGAQGKAALRSLESLRRFGLDYCVREVDQGSLTSAKTRLPELSPFQATLFLEPDAIVLDDLSFGFEMAARHGLALSIATTCWAGTGKPDLVQYDLGVVFFTRTPRTERLFDRWRRGADDGSFAQAAYDTASNPFVLPENWNFRAKPLVCGPIKIWNSSQLPPLNTDDWNRGSVSFGLIENGRIARAGWYPSTFRAAYPRS